MSIGWLTGKHLVSPFRRTHTRGRQIISSLNHTSTAPMRLTTEAPAERFGVAFCGGGPAVIGPVIAAARRGQLQEF
ncbi:hypothetical protein, partial [Streptomyces hydrogenans]|uniref:hypothetical protein n=1 Tax=Streptomyces hydrogenans TaxID=1873719 RepID=UPI0035D8F3BD